MKPDEFASAVIAEYIRDWDTDAKVEQLADTWGQHYDERRGQHGGMTRDRLGKLVGTTLYSQLDLDRRDSDEALHNAALSVIDRKKLRAECQSTANHWVAQYWARAKREVES